MSSDPIESSVSHRFALRYDELLGQPWVPLLYDRSGFFNAGWWDERTATQAEACMRLMDEVLDRLPLEPRALLDAGCGLGATTRALQQRFPAARVTGINISERQIAICRSAAPGVAFEVMDAARLRFDDASFDGVISVEAAFHFSTRDEFLAEAARVLVPGGQLVLTDILFRDVSVIGGWMVPAANRIQSLTTYAERLRDAGFVDVAVRDVTEECWTGFCDSLRRSIDGMAMLAGRLEEAVAHYVIASATRGEWR